MGLRDFLFHEERGITLYCGDCREVLPLMEPRIADLVLTDPPYLVADKVELRGTGVAPPRKPSSTIGDQGWTLTKDWLCAAARACSRHILAFCGYKDMADLLLDRGQGELRGIFTWKKSNAALPAWNVPHYDTEFALWFGRGPNPPRVKTIRSMVLEAPFPQAGCFSVERFVDSSGGALHPSQKPLHIMRMLCEAFAEESVLDPFVGTGTTLEAAKILNLRAIGIEIEPRYAEIAVKRLRQEVIPFQDEESRASIQSKVLETVQEEEQAVHRQTVRQVWNPIPKAIE